MNSLESVQNSVIEKYATIFPDIEPSIIKSVVLSTNNTHDIEMHLYELCSTIHKSRSERQNEFEVNYGKEVVAEVKFNQSGESHANSSSKPQNSLIKRLFKNSNRSNSRLKFEKFD